MKQYNTRQMAGKAILFATILASGMAFLDSSVVNIAIPVIQNKLQANIADIQWIVNGYALMLSSLILISGVLGDKFGRKRIFIYGIGLFTFSSFLCGISYSITSLILFRALQGIGAAMMVPGSLSIINISFEEKTRGRAIGLWSGFSGGIAAFGPFLGGVFVQFFGWPSIFFINIPLGFLALFISVRFIPETKNEEAKNIDICGATFIFLALFGIVYGLINGPVVGWSLIPALSLIFGICFLIVFLIFESRTKKPLVPFEIFKSSLVAGANLATLFLYFALSGVIFFLVLNFQQVQHYPPLLAGLGLMPTILLITFLSGTGGVIADRIGPRIPMIVGPLIVSIGMASLILPGKGANYFLQFMPGLILFGLGMSIVIAPLTKSALAVESNLSGTASGINNAVARIAGLLAIALLGAIMIFVFTTNLNQFIPSSSLKNQEKQIVLSQKDRLGGIQLPSSFNIQSRKIATTIIEDAFVNGFRWIMGINAILALLSSIVSFFTIHNRKQFD